MNNDKLVAIIMGSDSDLAVMQDAAKILEDLGIGFHLTVVSAHRTPKRMYDFAEHAAGQGFKVIIAGAGGAAHLPGMVASITSLPVIGVPIQSKSLSGLDSLLSIVQMPAGVPVATMAINGAKNAGLLAAQIIATGEPTLVKRITDYKAALQAEVEEKATRLEKMGFEKYLSS
ncbi:MAG: 5-(carboxyamino)imidazole ribonucleotide mutase [Flavobacteriaceae bacterium]|nr:5-(carboxyamino)imidazole ribonucleotide mutase [Flavobacteriaceae bacterium]